MATEFLTISKSKLQTKLAATPPTDFNLAIVARGTTDMFCACHATSGLSAKVTAWLSGGTPANEASLEAATVIPAGFTQIGFDGLTVAQIITEMEPGSGGPGGS